MIKILDRYLALNLLVFIAAAALFVLSIDALFAMVRELKSVGRADYHTMQAMAFVALTLPRRLYNIFPMAALLGAVMGLGALATHRELIVMRASGVSLRRISTVLLTATLLLTIGITALGEWVLPHSEFAAKRLKAEAKGRGKALFTAKGSWLKDGDDFIHIGEALPDGRLARVVKFEFDEATPSPREATPSSRGAAPSSRGAAPSSRGLTTGPKLSRISEAAHATFVGDHWELKGVKATIFHPDRVTTERLAKTTWASKLDAQMLEVLVRDPENLSLQELLHYQDYLRHNGLETEQYELSFWKKVLQPLSTLVIVFLAIPCVFGPLRDSSMGLRLLSGIMLGFLYYVVNELFGPLVLVYDWPPLLAALLPMVMFALLGQQLLRRV